MVLSDECIRNVKKIFAVNAIDTVRIALGEVETMRPLLPAEILTIRDGLKSEGYELIDISISPLVTKIKTALTELFEQNEIPEEFKLSTFLTEKLLYDYSHLSRVFSNHEKDTIEHYLIGLRIEKAKELLSYKDYKVSEVAYKLGYVSVAHFSRQFKKMVGVSPSIFLSRSSGQKPLDD